MPISKTKKTMSSNKRGVISLLLMLSSMFLPVFLANLMNHQVLLPALGWKNTYIIFFGSMLSLITPFFLIYNYFKSLKEESEQTNEALSEVNQKLDQLASTQSILAKDKDTKEETLKKEFLAVKKPFIYYIETERLSNFYNEEIAGRQSLEKLITRTGQELKGEVDAGIKGVVGVGMDGKITENKEEEFRVREPSILEMLLEVQTRFLKNDYFTLGVEKDSSERKLQTSEPNSIDENDTSVSVESQRLKDLEGLILIKIGFTLKLSEPDQSHYTLSFTRRLVESVEESPVVTFNTSFPRNSIAENDKFMFEKNLESTIKLILFGHVTSSKNSNEGNISVNIVPYAIYSP